MEALSTAIPLHTAIAVKLTSGGVTIDRTESLAVASNIRGLPCRITSTTEGQRR